MTEKTKDVVPGVPAQESQGLSKRHYGEKRDDVETNKDVLRTSTGGLDDVDKLRGFLHVSWGMTHVFPYQLHQILDQAVGGSPVVLTLGLRELLPCGSSGACTV
jgi:hypothetical protein